MRQAKFAMAEHLLKQLFPLRRQAQGDHHHDTITSARNLWDIFLSQGIPKLAEAADVGMWVLAANTSAHGGEDPRTLVAGVDLTKTLARQGRVAAARELGLETLALSTRVLGADHPISLAARGTLN